MQTSDRILTIQRLLSGILQITSGCFHSFLQRMCYDQCRSQPTRKNKSENWLGFWELKTLYSIHSMGQTPPFRDYHLASGSSAVPDARLGYPQKPQILQVQRIPRCDVSPLCLFQCESLIQK
mmetsp:Transcript_84207/g.171726  ORF Transcript_84207/g.171726 Transcript_84207/m.171726 type:complete len:122 (-) Transcript_84207:69-434(-)